MSKDVTYKSQTDIQDAAWARLLTQFQDSETLRQYIAGLLDPLADFEQALSDVRDALNVDVATGDALDKIGSIVGETRQGRADDTYRLFIKARIQINRAKGTPNEIINIISSLLQATEAYAALSAPEQATFEADVRLFEYYPAYFETEIVGIGLTTNDRSTFSSILDDIDPAGVGSKFVFAEDIDPLFRFNGDDATEGFDAGKFAS